MVRLEDVLILQHVLECMAEREEERPSPGRLIVDVGEYFLEACYAAGTLDPEGPEALVTNLCAFDCFTFVENCLAITLLMRQRGRTWNDFTAMLTKIRYRHGELNGYASRLHYFSDWLKDNVGKGILK
ncbi:MAG: DUF1460 domain-containing protein, partial [Syntrophales bacterium]|nr:DUF1460 domain-containing protein [Syntrophales bacterium]